MVDEIKAAGGDAFAVGGDVGSEEFPKKIVDATIQYASFTVSPAWSLSHSALWISPESSVKSTI